jgi:RNA polymerase sigma factor (sigma-70 family)
VVHDVFVGLAKQAGAGRAPRELSAYLYVAVRNRCMDRMRRKRELPLDDAALDLIVTRTGDEERIELRRVLNRALLALPAEQTEVVVLRTWHDLEFAAIAALQDTPVNTAIARYHYALAKLREGTLTPMNDERLESLLRGYALPKVSHALDQRALAQAGTFSPGLGCALPAPREPPAPSASATSATSSISSPPPTRSTTSISSEGSVHPCSRTTRNAKGGAVSCATTCSGSPRSA